MRVTTRLACALCLLAAPASGMGRVVYVRLGSHGNGSCWEAARPTIQAALDAAAPGDEVWAAEGTYYENVTFGPGDALYGGFAGTEADRDRRAGGPTVLDGSAAGSAATIPKGADGVILDNCTIRNGKAVLGGGIHAEAVGTLVTNCVIRDCQAGGSAYEVRGAGIYAGGGSMTVSRCTIENCRADGLFAYGGGICGQGTALVVTHCVVRHNNAIASDTAHGGGIYLAGSGRVANNLFVDDAAGGYENAEGGAVEAGGGHVEVVNNTITACSGNAIRPFYFCFGYAITVYSGNGSTVSNNVVALNYNGIYTAEGAARNNLSFRNDRCDNTPFGQYGNIGGDPLFVDAEAGDYRLRPGSPAIGAGDASAVLPGEQDLNGRPRISRGKVDMGAYQSLTAVSLSDAALALRAAGGLATLTEQEAADLDVAGGASAGRVDVADAVALARAAAQAGDGQ